MAEKLRNIKPRSFKDQKYYPGTTGNPFDRVLHGFLWIENIPAWLLILLLLPVSYLLGRIQIQRAIFIFGFYVLDFILLHGLPWLNLSFGPVKPPFVILVFLRALFWLLPFQISIWFQTIGSGLILAGFYLEPQFLEVIHQRYYSAKIAHGSIIKILHLGDLHIERFAHREERILRQVKEIQPDIILFSGDILNLSYLKDPTSQEDAKRFLRALSAPRGVYAVSGSPAVDLPELFPQLLQDTPVIWLHNCETRVNVNGNHLLITGLDCTHNPEMDFPRLKAIHSPQTECFSILLHHSPDLAPLSSQLDFDLQLSGHTHGGQIRIPIYGALFTGSLYHKLFEAGRYRLNQMILYVTRGLGLEGAAAPRVRLFCRPEITVWELQPKST